TAVWWWAWSALFYSLRGKPEWNEVTKQQYGDNWGDFQTDRKQWNLLHQAAGIEDLPKYPPQYTDANDLAESKEEFDQINTDINNAVAAINSDQREFKTGDGRVVPIDLVPGGHRVELAGKSYVIRRKPYGGLRTWPWFEDRGPNQYLLITGQAGPQWESGRFWEWFLTKQFPVLIEPLVKFLKPMVFLLDPNAGFWNRIYFLIVILGTLATWAFFGGAITRMAAVQLTRNEKISLTDAVKFVCARYV